MLNFDVKDGRGNTILGVLCCEEKTEENFELKRMLLNATRDINKKGLDDNNCLVCAIKVENEELFGLLLERSDLDPNVQLQYSTPFNWAVRYDRKDLQQDSMIL